MGPTSASKNINTLPFSGVAEENQQDSAIYGGHLELSLAKSWEQLENKRIKSTLLRKRKAKRLLLRGMADYSNDYLLN